MKKYHPWLRVLAIVLALLLVAALMRHFHVVHHVARGAELARNAGPAGVVLVVLAFLTLTLALFPMVPLLFVCGWIYGMAGAAISLPAATLSATIAFLVGRAFGREWLSSALQTRPRMRLIADLASRGGLVTVALLRVSPILPFTPSNAALGMTDLRLRDLVLGTFFGILPGGLLCTSVGSLLPDAAAIERGELPPGAFWLLLGLGIVAMGIIGTTAARKLRRMSRETAP